MADRLQHSIVLFAGVEALRSKAGPVSFALLDLARPIAAGRGCSRSDLQRSSKAPVLLILDEGRDRNAAPQAHLGSMHV
jgi:hypothetical protein